MLSWETRGQYHVGWKVFSSNILHSCRWLFLNHCLCSREKPVLFLSPSFNSLGTLVPGDNWHWLGAAAESASLCRYSLPDMSKTDCVQFPLEERLHQRECWGEARGWKAIADFFFSSSSFNLLAHLQVWRLFSSLLLFLTICINGSLEAELTLVLFPADLTPCCCSPVPKSLHQEAHSILFFLSFW